MSYRRKTYPVKVEGMSVGEVGVTRATAKVTSTTQGASLRLGAEGLRLTLAK